MDVVRDAAALSELADAWEKLFLASGRPHIHQSPDWLTLWWKHFGHGCQLHVLRARDESGQLRALAPFITEPVKGRVARLLGLRQLSFLGRHLVDAAGILAPEGEEALWAERFAQELLKSTDWHTASLRQLLSDEPYAEVMKRCFEKAGLHPELETISRSPRLPLKGSFEDYYAALGTGWRYDIERNQRRLAKAGTPAEFHLTDQVDAAKLAEMHDLNEKRAAAGDTRRTPLLDPARRAFLTDLCTPLSLKKRWRLAELRVGGSLAAYQLGFVIGGTHYFWNIAQAPEHAAYSTGKILLKMNLESCWSAGLHTFDFMAGDESYKAHWTQEGRDNLALNVTRPGWRTRLWKRLTR